MYIQSFYACQKRIIRTFIKTTGCIPITTYYVYYPRMQKKIDDLVGDGQGKIPTPPSKMTELETLHWLEEQNKRETKEQRQALRTKIRSGISEILSDQLFGGNDQQVELWRRLADRVVVQKHIEGIAVLAGSPYKMIRANKDDEELTPRTRVLVQKIESLLLELASDKQALPSRPSAVLLADLIDSTFSEDRRLRNSILQRSHAITKVNSFLINKSKKQATQREMPDYYKSIGEYISSCVSEYESILDNSASSSLKAMYRRHATEWAAFTQKYLITSKKIRSEKSAQAWLDKVKSRSRYESEIQNHLLSSAVARTISTIEFSAKSNASKRADYLLINGIQLDFKARGLDGFLAIANFPSTLKTKPFRIMAEMQHMAEGELKLPEMEFSFLGNPPIALEISIRAHTNPDTYEQFAEFIVKALSTIK